LLPRNDECVVVELSAAAKAEQGNDQEIPLTMSDDYTLWDWEALQLLLTSGRVKVNREDDLAIPANKLPNILPGWVSLTVTRKKKGDYAIVRLADLPVLLAILSSELIEREK
jgi:hypothetical protein